MSASRVRVRPPHSHWGLLVLSAFLGAVMAVPVAAYVWMWFWIPEFFRFFQYNFWIINSIQAAIALIPFLLFLIWLPRQCQHARWIAASGATYAVSLASFSMLGVDLHLPWAAWDQLAENLLLLPLAAIVGAMLALLSLVIHRNFISTLIEQNGTLCNHCGYPAHQSRSMTCPECGKTIEHISPTRSERRISFFARNRRSTIAAMTGVFLLGYGLVVWTEREHRTLGQSFGEEWTWTDWQTFVVNDPATAAYRFIEIGDNVDGTVIAVALTQQPVWRKRELHILLGYVIEGRTPGFRVIAPGNPMVVTEVPRGHVRHVLRNGPPAHVVQRLIETAREAEWGPVDPWWRATEVIDVPWEAEAEE